MPSTDWEFPADVPSDPPHMPDLRTEEKDLSVGIQMMQVNEQLAQSGMQMQMMENQAPMDQVQGAEQMQVPQHGMQHMQMVPEHGMQQMQMMQAQQGMQHMQMMQSQQGMQMQMVPAQYGMGCVFTTQGEPAMQMQMMQGQFPADLAYAQQNVAPMTPPMFVGQQSAPSTPSLVMAPKSGSGTSSKPSTPPIAVMVAPMNPMQSAMQQQQSQLQWQQMQIYQQAQHLNNLKKRVSKAEGEKSKPQAKAKAALPKQPPVGLGRQVDGRTERIRWTLDTRRITSSAMVVMSQGFEIGGVSFKMMLQPWFAEDAPRKKGMAGFKAAAGFISLSVKSEGAESQAPETWQLRFYMAEFAPRGPVSQDFSQSPVARLPGKDAVWDIRGLLALKPTKLTVGIEFTPCEAA